MISPNQIARLASTEAYVQLVSRILDNGRCESAIGRRVLTQPGCAMPAGLGLGLQRLTELSYGPTAAGADIAFRLLGCQHADGSFGPRDPDRHAERLACTAVAVRGLLSWNGQTVGTGRSADASITTAICSGLSHLSAEARDLCSAVTEAQPPSEDDAVGWAIVLWQLGGQIEFRATAPIDALVRRIEVVAGDVIGDELGRYARMMAA